MSNNYYDLEDFFSNYEKLRQNKFNANDLIEYPALKPFLDKIKNGSILDLGCGTGTYSRILSKNNQFVKSVDLSAKMLESFNNVIRENSISNIETVCSSIEEFNIAEDSYDFILSTLAFHYLENLNPVFADINKGLKSKGKFVLSVEHPVLTATKNIGWHVSDDNYEHWRLDNYFETGMRKTSWLGADVVKYHRTFEDYFNLFQNHNFEILSVVEANLPKKLLILIKN